MRDRTGPVNSCSGGCGRFVAVNDKGMMYRHLLSSDRADVQDNICPGSELEEKEPLWQVLGFQSEEMYMHSLDDAADGDAAEGLDMLYGLSDKGLAARFDVESTSGFEEKLIAYPHPSKRLNLVVVESRDFVAVYEEHVLGRCYNYYKRTSVEAFTAEYVKQMLQAKGHFVVVDTEIGKDPFTYGFETARAEWDRG